MTSKLTFENGPAPITSDKRMKLRFKDSKELESFFDPRNKLFVDWTNNVIELRGPRID